MEHLILTSPCIAGGSSGGCGESGDFWAWLDIFSDANTSGLVVMLHGAVATVRGVDVTSAPLCLVVRTRLPV